MADRTKLSDDHNYYHLAEQFADALKSDTLRTLALS